MKTVNPKQLPRVILKTIVKTTMPMKKKFSGKIVPSASQVWTTRTKGMKWLSDEVIASVTSHEHRIETIIHQSYISCEYKIKLNIFSFGRFKLNIPFIVIAPPISVDEIGYNGDFRALIEDYKARKGFFLTLNLRVENLNIPKGLAAIGKTLPSCIFNHRFDSFEMYLNALRSPYRRRVKTALKKGESLETKRINPLNFDNEIYSLYLQVLNKSKFPLETLPISFFQKTDNQIDVFYFDSKPLAFAMYQMSDNILEFIFGGLDYQNRDAFDLYYNMLLHLIKLGIDKGARKINLGQTAESTKCRLGAKIENRYMVAFSGNRLVNSFLCKMAFLLENNKTLEEYKVFKDK